jgi:hypothetical protein
MSRVCWTALGLSLLAIAGCGGDEVVPGPVKVSKDVVSAELLGKMWPVELADDGARARFENEAGWTYLFERSYGQALGAFAASGDAAGLARVHQEYAAVYRQGALVAANATHHAYSEDRAPTDPAGLQYMVGVAERLRGAGGEAALAEAQTVAAVSAHSTAWATAADGLPLGLPWLESRTGAMGPVKAGTQPVVAAMPHFKFPERTEQAALVEANDPTLLLGLSEWHLQAARQAQPESASDLDLVMSGWRLPVEPVVSTALSGDTQAWLFARSVLCPEDLGFLAAVNTDGPDAVSTWAERSPLAAAIAPAWNGERLDPQVVLDQSVLLMRQAEAAMAVASGGKAGFHRPFALFVRLGVLRAGMRVADKAGQYRDAGILRLEALERMEGGKGSVQRDPAFALSVAAWDASNRSPLRPEEILHKLIPDFPALAVARSPLEALHLRLNRHAAPSTPVH